MVAMGILFVPHLASKCTAANNAALSPSLQNRKAGLKCQHLFSINLWKQRYLLLKLETSCWKLPFNKLITLQGKRGLLGEKIMPFCFINAFLKKTMVVFKVGERERKDVPIAGVLQIYSNISCADGMMGL